MVPESAVIRTAGDYPYRKKICGLYPLERNIILLSQAGVKKIYLDLSVEEKLFFKKTISSRISDIRTEIVESFRDVSEKGKLVIDSGLILQQHQLDRFDLHFKESDRSRVPVLSDEIFSLNTAEDFKKAARLLKDTILKKTHGFIAREINKKISLPISMLAAAAGIHPNIITAFNTLLGIASAVFMFMSADNTLSPGNQYLYMMLGGLFFQFCSIFDGVDGEVAKLTLKVSKIGGWLDTISDNVTLFLFLAAASYVNFYFVGGWISIVSAVIMFAGLFVVFSLILSYLTRYGEGSGSFVRYVDKFIMKMPKDDPVVRLVLMLKYILTKEVFSFLFMGGAVAGKATWIMPGTAIVLTFGATLISIVHFRYISRAEEFRGL